VQRAGRARSADAEAAFRRAVDEAKAAHNLSDVVGRRTTLKRRGRELVGLCPFHHEKTPSFEVNDAKGFYHCHGCGAGGDAIRFLMELDGLSFRGAFQALTGGTFPIVSEEERAKRKAADAAEDRRRRDLARTIWAKSVPAAATLAEVYARSRGITAPLPPTVRFAMTPRWIDPETGQPGRDYPALVCAMQDHEGALAAVQCVFLADGGRRKYHRVRDDGTVAKAKLTFGVIVGSALRIGPPGPTVMLCEGPEDGLTLAQTYPMLNIWVACGTALLSRVVFPGDVQAVILAGDNGAAGRRAVDEATAAYMAQGLRVDELFPGPRFKDFNDQLRGIAC
jgi:DNA primase